VIETWRLKAKKSVLRWATFGTFSCWILSPTSPAQTQRFSHKVTHKQSCSQCNTRITEFNKFWTSNGGFAKLIQWEQMVREKQKTTTHVLKFLNKSFISYTLPYTQQPLWFPLGFYNFQFHCVPKCFNIYSSELKNHSFTAAQLRRNTNDTTSSRYQVPNVTSQQASHKRYLGRYRVSQ